MIDAVLKFLRESITVADIAYETGFDLQQLCESTSLVVELGADDLDMLLIAMDLEDNFEISISDAEIDELTSPAAIARLLGTKL